MRGQGSLEYLLLIGGGVLVAVVIISAILSIPQTAGGSNEYGVATAQCLAHTQSNCSGTITVGQNQYTCVWNPSEGKCLATLTSCNFTAPINPFYHEPVGDNFTVTLQYNGFTSDPNGSMTGCQTGGTLSCSGGVCNSADCGGFSASSGEPINANLIANLIDGATNANCSYSLTINYCGDGTCQAGNEDSASCSADCEGDGQTCIFNSPTGGAHAYLGQPVSVDIGHTYFLPRPDRSHYNEAPEQTYGPPTPKVRCETNGGANTADLTCTGMNCTGTCNYTTGGSKAFPIIDLQNATQTAACNGPTITIDYCGDGIINGTETCDDGGTVGGDGCSAACAIESDWECFGEPSDCYYDISACGFSSWVDGRQYTLKRDLTGVIGTCLSMASSVNNVLLDCKQKTITAPTGVTTDIASGFTVRNCIIKATTEGIQAGGLASGATIKDNVVSITGSLGMRYGIRLLTTSFIPTPTNHTVENNTITFTRYAATNRAIYVHQNARNNTIKSNHASCLGGNGGQYSIEVGNKGAQNSLSGNNYCPSNTCSGPSPVCNGVHCDNAC